MSRTMVGTSRSCSPCPPTRPSGRRADRPDVDPHADLQVLSAWACLLGTGTGRTTSPGSSSWFGRRPWRTTPISGGMCALTRISAPSRYGCATRRRARAHDRAGGPDPGNVRARRALRRAQHPRDLSARDARREQVACARTGSREELIDLPSSSRVTSIDLARRLRDRLRPHARELNCEREFDGIDELIERGTGSTAPAIGVAGEPRHAHARA